MRDAVELLVSDLHLGLLLALLVLLCLQNSQYPAQLSSDPQLLLNISIACSPTIVLHAAHRGRTQEGYCSPAQSYMQGERRRWILETQQSTPRRQAARMASQEC